MAGSIQKTIEIIFAGSDIGFSGTTKAVGDGIQSLSNDVNALVTPLASVGKGILAFESAAATLAVGGIAFAIKKSSDFSASIAEINTLLNLGGPELDQYARDIDEYSTTSTQSIESINEALYNAISMGVNYKDSLTVLSAAEKLAVGGKAGLNEALEVLIGTMNAYGAPMSEITSYSDTFFTIVKDGKTTIPELSASLANVTGIASAGGVSFDVLGSAVATLTAAGAKTPEAITKIRAAIEALLKPTPAASKAAKDLGIDLSEAALKSKGFPVVLQEIYDKTGGSVEKMGRMITSTEGVQAALILGADKSGVFAKALEDMANKAGATDKAFKEMKDNLGLFVVTMLNNWYSMIRKFGSSLEDGSKDLISAFSDLWKSIKKGIDNGTFEPILKMINDFTKGAEDDIKRLAKNLPDALKGVDFNEFVKSVRELKDEILNLFGIDLSSKTAIQGSIQRIVDSFVSLNKISASMITAFDPVKDVIIDLTDWFNSLDASTQKFIGSALGISMIAAPLTVVAGSVGSMITAFGGLAGVSSSIGGLIGRITGGGGLKAAITAVTARIAPFVAAMTGPVGITVAIAAVVAALVLKAKHMKDGIAETDKHIAAMEKESEAWLAIARAAKDLPKEHRMKILTILEKEGVAAAQKYFDSIPEESKHKIIVDGVELSQAEIKKFRADYDGIPREKKINIKVDTKNLKKNVKEAMDYIETTLPDGTTKRIYIEAKADKPSLEKTKKAVKKELNPLKVLDIKTKLDIAKLESTTSIVKGMMETINTKIEWDAKINISKLENETKQVEAILGGLSSSVSAVSGNIGSMFGTMAGVFGNENMDWIDERNMFNLMDKEMKLQEKLINAQVKASEAFTKRIVSGEPIKFQVESTNLEPALEMIWQNVLEKAQVTLNSEGLGLLGAPAT